MNSTKKHHRRRRRQNEIDIEMIKHDLRNFLNIINGNVQLIELDTPDIEELSGCKKGISDMLEYINRLETIIKKLSVTPDT